MQTGMQVEDSLGASESRRVQLHTGALSTSPLGLLTRKSDQMAPHRKRAGLNEELHSVAPPAFSFIYRNFFQNYSINPLKDT